MTSRRVGILGVALSLLAGTAVPLAAQAQEQTTYRIQVGDFIDFPRAESTRFFPSTIRVHPGDTLHFESDIGHTVTILTAGQDPDEWVAANWAGGDAVWSPYVEEPDEPGSVKSNMRVMSASHLCGWPTQPACRYAGFGDSTFDVLNSGLPIFMENGQFTQKKLFFDVTITASPGTTLWALSVMHPGARMRIEVVAPDEVASDQAAIDAQAAQDLAADTAEANALHAEFKKKREKRVTQSGTSVWQAWAGIETESVALRTFYPRRIVIRKGDRVQWNFDRLRWRADTVTFPARRGLNMLSEGPEIRCDPDGDAGAAPDRPQERQEFPFCNDPSQLELQVPSGVMTKMGNNVYTGRRDVAHSGVRGAMDLPRGDAPYFLRFRKKSPRKGFRYVGTFNSFAHGAMSGRVVVRRR